jgi:CheY-like chemotaxis protein
MGLQILVADDEADVRDALADLLRHHGHDVRVVENGPEVFDVLGAGYAPDVIITDVHMPGLHGLTIVEELRADGFPQPLIVISADRDRELKKRLARVEGVRFFEKPLDPDALLHAVEAA